MIYHFAFFCCCCFFFFSSVGASELHIFSVGLLRLNDVRKNTPCLHREQKRNVLLYICRSYMNAQLRHIPKKQHIWEIYYKKKEQCLTIFIWNLWHHIVRRINILFSLLWSEMRDSVFVCVCVCVSVYEIEIHTTLDTHSMWLLLTTITVVSFPTLLLLSRLTQKHFIDRNIPTGTRKEMSWEAAKTKKNTHFVAARSERGRKK